MIKQKSLVLCMGLALAASSFSSVAEEKAATELKTDKDKLSYSLGVTIGDNIARQKADVNYETLLLGIQHAMEGKKLILSPDIISSTMMDFHKKSTEERKKVRDEQANKNEAAGNAYLAENEKKDGVVKLPSGLQYKVVKAIETGETVKPTDKVKVHYRGTLIDGSEFDSSYSRNEPATFGVLQVIKGWTEALLLMKPGEKWELAIPYNLAYGENGRPPKIGPKSTLLFEVELLEIVK